ncbi:MAG TPA: hypothetical protein VJ571_08165 [Candidatus Nitrosotalea sp.]|nr:hypothetical protein [Candidatus Nitrosotalea sp.]
MSSKINNYRITFAILVLVIITGIAVTPVFASPALLNYTGANQTTTSGNTGGITVTTDKTSYNDGDTVTISGSTQDYISGTLVTVIITTPTGNLVMVNQVNLGSDRTYSTSITATGVIWQAAGIYTVKVQYGSSGETAQTTFQFAGSIPSQSGNTIPVDGTNFSAQYGITNGKILGIKADIQSKSLMISTQTSGDGVLTITLPRTLINSILSNGQDGTYQVLVGSQEADFQETSTTTTDRTLSIPFTDRTQEIEIIGTSLVENEIAPTLTQYNPGSGCLNCNNTGNTQQTSSMPITVTTDQSVYHYNSKIIISGHVTDSHSGQQVGMQITSPSGNVASANNIDLDNNGDYTTSINIIGNIWAENGQYKIMVQEGDDQTKSDSIFFQLIEAPTMLSQVGNSSTPQASNSNTACSNCNQTSSAPPASTTVTSKIPSWVKGIFNYYGQGQVSDDELLGAIKFLVNQGIIKLD